MLLDNIPGTGTPLQVRDPNAWTQAKICTSPRATVTGLQSGKKYAFRVRAVGAAGEGAWSGEAVVMAS